MRVSSLLALLAVRLGALVLRLRHLLLLAPLDELQRRKSLHLRLPPPRVRAAAAVGGAGGRGTGGTGGVVAGLFSPVLCRSTTLALASVARLRRTTAALAIDKADWLVTCYRENTGLFWHGLPPECILLHWMGDERGNHIPAGVNATPIAIPIGTQMLHAAGLAWAEKAKKTGAIAVTFFGGAGE